MSRSPRHRTDVTRRGGTDGTGRDGDGSAEVPIGGGLFDPRRAADELAAAPDNHELGTSLCSRTSRSGRRGPSEPGQRGPFHVRPNLLLDRGGTRRLQRFADAFVVRDYELGETKYLVHSRGRSSTTWRTSARRRCFVTVELKG